MFASPVARGRALVFALLAALLAATTEQVIEHFAREQAHEQEKNRVLQRLSTLRARLEGVIASNLLLVHGLTAVIGANPDIDQAGFARIAQGLVDERYALRNIAAAPDLVVRLMYPLAGNEAAIGLDYRSHPTQKGAAMRVAETGEPWVAGPLPLVQGGTGVVAREPVFVPAPEAGGEPRLWGLVSAVIDVDTLYRQAGLEQAAAELHLAIRGTDGAGAAGPVFYGDPGVFAGPRVTQDVFLPGGSWHMAARPAAGWHQGDETVVLIRLLGLVAAVAAAALTYLLVRGNEALRRSEARYRALLEGAPFPAVLSRLDDGEILYGNHRAEVQFGLRREAGIGQHADAFYQHPEDRARFVAALAASGRVDDFEVPLRALDGRPFWALLSAAVVALEDEAVLFTAVNDITARRQLDQQVRQLNAELEERVRRRTAELAAANRELETFSYSVSHDLKAPLRGIDGYARLLQEDYADRLDADGRQFLASVRHGVEQMNQLIEGLLAYSRLERRPLDGAIVDLGPLVEQVLEERQGDLAARDARVTVDLAGVSVRADPQGLAVVVRNLVDNALKFSRDRRPPEVRITAEADGQSAILAIRDNGIGFDMQFQDRIFDIFQRLQRSEDYPGTGLGLAIVAKAVQRMGGRVWAESAPGQGATFYVELPR